MGGVLLGAAPPVPFPGPRLLQWLLLRFRRQEASLVMVERALQVPCAPMGRDMRKPRYEPIFAPKTLISIDFLDTEFSQQLFVHE